MIRVDAKKLAVAAGAFLECLETARDVSGHKLAAFGIDKSCGETALCAAMSFLTNDYVSPSDVVFVSGFGTDKPDHWPKNPRAGFEGGVTPI